jgi:putative endonuclease
VKQPSYVYILANRKDGTLYIGATMDLVARTAQHKSRSIEGFTKTYGVDRLVYFEPFGDIETAVQRERQIKKWNRAWKIRAIEERNPEWRDLYPDIAIP